MIRYLPLLALFFVATVSAVDESELLPPEEAFALEVSLAGPRAVRLNWNVAEGYYLYKGRLGFATETETVTLGEAELPPGKPYEDEFFGKVETYRGPIAGRLPISERPDEATRLSLQVRYQGCADVGVCYPPQRRTMEVDLPRVQPVSLLKGLPGSSGGVFASPDNPLPEDEAFRFEAIALAPDQILARWTIAPDHYIYREQFRFSLTGEGATLGNVDIPRGQPKTDEHFGAVEVFYNEVEVPVDVVRTGNRRGMCS